VPQLRPTVSAIALASAEQVAVGSIPTGGTKTELNGFQKAV